MLYADLNEEHLRLLEAPFIQSMFAADDVWDARGLHQDPEEALEQLKAGVSFPMLEDVSHWLSLGSGLHIGSSWDPLCGDAADTPSFQKDLDHLGFATGHPPHSPRIPGVLDALLTALDRLTDAGFAPTFLFVFDETWQVLEAAVAQLADVLGPDAVLEPSFFVYKLVKEDVAPAQATGRQSIGNSFPLPHRDLSHAECHDAGGAPTMLSVWVPLTDATLNNGCMYVVPREFDGDFDRPAAYSHLRPAVRRLADADGPTSVPIGTSAEFRPVPATELRFDVSGARALPVPASTLCCWHANLIHWGSRCASDATRPRVSLACTVRRAGAARSHLDRDLPGVPLGRFRTLSLADRLRMIGSTLLVFKYWYSLDHWAPPEFRVPAERGATLTPRPKADDPTDPPQRPGDHDPHPEYRRAYHDAVFRLTVLSSRADTS